VEQKLKRGRMPDYYNYQQLKEEIRYLMEEYEEDEVRVADILVMVDRALEEMAQEKSRRENQLRDEMRIIINLDSIHEEEEDEPDNNHPDEAADDEMIFGYQDEEAEQ
jgi:K+/H+ antiporter YhaU regulatory subunit KhtT